MPKFHCSRCNTYFFLNNTQDEAVKCRTILPDGDVEGTQLELIPAPAPKIKKRKSKLKNLWQPETAVSEPVMTVDWPESFVSNALGAAGGSKAEHMGRIMSYGQPMLEGNIYGNVATSLSTTIPAASSHLPASCIEWPGNSSIRPELDWSSDVHDSELQEEELRGMPAVDFKPQTVCRVRQKPAERFARIWTLFVLPFRGIKIPRIRLPKIDLTFSRARGPISPLVSTSLLLSPLITVFLLLGWTSSQLKAGNASAEHFFALFAPEKNVRIPPLGVGILNTEAERITLDDGRTVIEVRGRVANTTVTPFEELQIEAVIFDTQNRPLTRKIITLHNSLAAVQRLQSLKRESITELQAQTLDGGSILKPSSVENFRVVLDSAPDGGVWYSARVYSLVSE